ncbi:related to ATP-binding cassette protein (ABC) transporter [Sporisorium reilianum f. sp. reilianum]|uniref:Related to ATP-binding cassette protein (ABC) transporter n=1 Tax=Sporisorium reilianum f. sp. reilianum TaxID=72559 RepID=A0A2N8UF73_9BASI|nr:related to ATP-binding cassette protein (ABC) transporter [Sporisorium reilianum f. sp. reilianum]
MTEDIESAAHGGGLAWEDLKYSVPLKRSLLSRFSRRTDTSAPTSEKVLLSGLSGSIVPGEMLAIMGASGAGKSTLLDVLSTRKPPTCGSVSACGDIKAISSYVEQSDSLLGVLTVRETIWYSAKLSLPASTPTRTIDERTDLVMHDLGLAAIAHSRIGTPLERGISGGQKRRVSIACSLVTLPRILFLDEPTSGLDTFTAHEVIAAIRNLAKRNGIAVLATIHSPNWEIFSSFDRVLLLGRGREVYQGAIGRVVGWFAGLGYRCGEHTNPADFMVGLVNDDFAGREVAEKEGVVVKRGDTVGFADAWAKHVATRVTGSTLPVKSGEDGGNSDSASSSGSATQPLQRAVSHPDAIAHLTSAARTRMTSLLSQTLTLTRRNLLNYSRNLLAYGVRFGMYVGMGVLLATVWIRLAPTDMRINDRLSVHFFSVAFLGFMAVAGIPAFLEERAVLLREAGNRLYTPLAFTLAQTVSTLPLLFACSAVFSVIAYWAIGLHPGAAHFGRFLAYLYLGVVAAEFQALLIAAAIPVFVAALAVCAFLNGFWMCVQGYFIRHLPAFWHKWAHWIDYETYAFGLLVDNDFRGLEFACEGSVANGDCVCQWASSLVAQGTCAVSGEDVLSASGVGDVRTGMYVGVLVAIAVVYRLLFWVVLRLQLK